MLGKRWLTSITAATLLASPALAGWPSAQPAQIDALNGQRIIREVVVNGAGSGRTRMSRRRTSFGRFRIGSTTAARSIAGLNMYGE